MEAAFNRGDSSQRVLSTGPDGSQSSSQKMLHPDVEIRVKEIGRDRLQLEAGTSASVSDDQIVRWLKEHPTPPDAEMLRVMENGIVKIKSGVAQVLEGAADIAAGEVLMKDEGPLPEGAHSRGDAVRMFVSKLQPDINETAQAVTRESLLQELYLAIGLYIQRYSERARQSMGKTSPGPKVA